MTASADGTCPACGEDESANYEAMNGRFRLWCAMCGHSTAQYSDLALARLEWLGSRDEEGQG